MTMLDVLALIAKAAAGIVIADLLLVLTLVLWITWRDRGDVDARVPAPRLSTPESGGAHANIAHLDWSIPDWVNNATATPAPGRPACPVIPLDERRHRHRPTGDAA